MDGTQRFIWAAAATMVALSIIGFFVIDASTQVHTQVHTQFSLDGWTTSYPRTTSLLLLAGAGVLAAFVLTLAIKMNEGLTWLRWLAIAVMTLLPITQLLSIIEAA